MLRNLKITFVNKRKSAKSHERIRDVGGTLDGVPWSVTEPEAIAALRGGKFRFYVIVGGRSIDITVAAHQGRKYLKTREDGYAPSTLLRLPDRP